MHKRPFVAHAKALNNYLGFTSKSTNKSTPSKATNGRSPKTTPQPALAALTGLVLIFTITAIIHLLGDYSMLGTGPCIAYPPSGNSPDPSSPTSIIPFGAFLFFASQIPGLIFEKTIIALPQRFHVIDENLDANARKQWKVVGYIWVYGWCALTLPLWIGPHIRYGCWEKTLEIYGPLMMGWKGFTAQ